MKVSVSDEIQSELISFVEGKEKFSNLSEDNQSNVGKLSGTYSPALHYEQ